MKLHNILISSLIACITFSSCNDWLDVEPNTEMDRNNLFKDEAGFADALCGVYTNMSNNDLYGKNLTWYMVELMGGGATFMFGNNGNYAAYSFHPDAPYYMESLRNEAVDPIWNKGYNAIANLNSIIESIDEKKNVFVGNDFNTMKGEAIGLRAFLHFDLLRLFGSSYTSNTSTAYIPYVSKLTSEVHPLLTVDQACKAIISDLKEAKELLKDDPMFTNNEPSPYVCSTVTGAAFYRKEYGIQSWHNRRFHFNYYAAVATMARVYLWMGDTTNALTCAKEIIEAPENRFPWVNPTLIANINNSSQYTSRDRTFCTEQIFSLNITDMPDRMDGYMYEGENSFTGSNGNILGINTSCFEANTQMLDPRYAYLKKTYSVYGSEFYLSTKYYKDEDYNNSYSPWSANRVPLIRVSEMYYIAAECESNLNKATQYLEQVRQHRGLTSLPLSCNSKEELQQQIEQEYRKEFIAEGQLFYYYKRKNKDITTKGSYNTNYIEPTLFILPRPDDENTYGGRTSSK